MSYTTNMSTGASPLTYANLERDCARLAEIAGQMANLAQSNDHFRDALEFDELRTALREQFSLVSSLIIAI